MAAKKCRVILFLPPKAVQDIYPAIKWFSNHFIKKQYYTFRRKNRQMLPHNLNGEASDFIFQMFYCIRNIP